MSGARTEPQCPRWACTVMAGCWVSAALTASAPFVFSLPADPHLPTALRWGATLLLAAAAWRPFEALLVVAAFAPLGRTLSSLAGGSASATELMVPAVLLGGVLRLLVRPGTLGVISPVLMVSATALAAVALTSVAVGMAAQAPFYLTSAEWRRAILEFVSRGYYGDGGRFATLGAGFQLAQGVLLVPLVVWLVSSERRRVRLVAMLVAGAAAAGAQVAVRVTTAAVASGRPFEALLGLMSGVRVTAAFPDPNANGSFYALVAALAMGLLCSERLAVGRAERTLAGAGLVLTGAGLWLAGSRVAMGALPAGGLLAALALPTATRGLAARRVGWVALTAVLTIALVAAAELRRGASDGSTALMIRVEFVRTTWRMLRDHPIFGVGAGQYAPQAERYSSDALKRFYRRENAHNQFLQILGELGPFALAAFLAVCGHSLTTSVRRLRAVPGDRISLAVLAATLAYLLTCLAGHPILVMEAAVPFWIATGLAASTVGPADTRRAVAGSPKLGAAAAATIVFSLGVSLQPRIEAARDALHLEHVLIGAGRWRHVNGVPEVEFRGRLAVYVPARGQRAWVSVRPADDEHEPIQLTLRLDGRLADVVRLDTPAWRTMALLLPTSGAQRFRLLQLEARRADGSPVEPRVHLRRVVTQR